MRKIPLPGIPLTDEQAAHFAQFFHVGYYNQDRRQPLINAIIVYLQGNATSKQCAASVELGQQTFRAHAREFLICGLLEMSAPNMKKLLTKTAKQGKKSQEGDTHVLHQ